VYAALHAVLHQLSAKMEEFVKTTAPVRSSIVPVLMRMSEHDVKIHLRAMVIASTVAFVRWTTLKRTQTVNATRSSMAVTGVIFVKQLSHHQQLPDQQQHFVQTIQQFVILELAPW